MISMNLMFRIFRKGLSLLGQPYAPFVGAYFSQDGEDAVLRSFYEPFDKEYKGFYVDIGAHHPFRFSNTFLFYSEGWSGINVDAMPGSMKLFRKYRKRDINLEIGVGSKEEELLFYCFKEPALNTFDRALAESRIQNKWLLLNTVTVKVQTLESILDQYLPKGKVIDFLTIDAEGLDMDVLKSNNWEKYKPKYVLAEAYGENNNLNDISDYLNSKGYQAIARVQRGTIFSRLP